MIVSPQRRSELLRLARLLRLADPYDLGFLLAMALCASWLAAGGTPAGDRLLVFLLGALVIRCAAWVFVDFAEARFTPASRDSMVARGEVDPQYALRLFALLCAIGFACAVYLGRLTVLFSPLVWGLVVAFPYARQRTFLSTLLIAGAFAWSVPMAWFALGEGPGVVGWLLFIAALLWAAAFGTLFSASQLGYERRAGIHSLAGLTGDAVPVAVGLLQAGALVAFALAARREGLGPLFELGWLWAAAVFAYQLWMMVRGRAGDLMRAYRGGLWFGVALFMGIAADFLCASGKPA